MGITPMASDEFAVWQFHQSRRSLPAGKTLATKSRHAETNSMLPALHIQGMQDFYEIPYESNEQSIGTIG